jgi:hypothetical protein
MAGEMHKFMQREGENPVFTGLGGGPSRYYPTGRASGMTAAVKLSLRPPDASQPPT